MPVEGQLLGGKYRLERFLGSGGFASVWAARNIDIDRAVALKILADTFARNPEFVSRFLREAKLAAKPIHETVIRVEDIGQTDEGAPFLVMELLEGQSLSASLRERGALPVEEALEIAQAVLAGVAAAHRLGIIHRDIKPANVFLTAPGTVGAHVRILDLGLGKDLGDEAGLTHTGQMMGTPDYMAPELLVGDQLGAASPASDVFALGVLIFEMLTGRRPLEGLVPSTSSTSGFVERAMFYQRGGKLPHVRAVEAVVPEVVDELLARALAVDASERFLDAGDMLDGLEMALGEMAPTRAHVLPEVDGPTRRRAPSGSAPAGPDSAVSGISRVDADGGGGEVGPSEEYEDYVPTVYDRDGEPAAPPAPDPDSHLRMAGADEEPPREAVAAVGGVFVAPGERAEDSESLEVASTTPVRRAAGVPIALDPSPSYEDTASGSLPATNPLTEAAAAEVAAWGPPRSAPVAPPPARPGPGAAAGAARLDPTGPATPTPATLPPTMASDSRSVTVSSRSAVRAVWIAVAVGVPLLFLLGFGVAVLAISGRAPQPLEDPPSALPPLAPPTAPPSTPSPATGPGVAPVDPATVPGAISFGARPDAGEAEASTSPGEEPGADAGPEEREERRPRRPPRGQRRRRDHEDDGDIPFDRVGRGEGSGR